MTALPVQSFIEPTEREDPRNALVRAFEAQIEAMIDNGLEAPVRAIIARLLPPPPPAADLFTPPPPAAAADLEIFAPAGELALVSLVADCRRFEKFKMPAMSHEAVSRIKAGAEAALAKLKADRTVAP